MVDQQDSNASENADSIADTVVATVLIFTFVALCIFWISGQ